MSAELEKYYQELGIGAAHLGSNQLPFCKQAELGELEVVDIDFAGRAFVISKAAAPSWRSLQSAAIAENVLLGPASGFRSYLYQAKLIQGQLVKGRTLNEILTGMRFRATASIIRAELSISSLIPRFRRTFSTKPRPSDGC